MKTGAWDGNACWGEELLKEVGRDCEGGCGGGT